MTPNNTGKRITINLWKWLFMLLLTANLAFVTVLASRFLQIREPLAESLAVEVEEEVSIGQFSTNRQSINELLAVYLEDYQTKEFSYQVLVGSTTILFEGHYQLFNYQIPLYIYLTPYLLDEGVIRLDIDSFSVGTLSLPTKEMLRYIKSNYNLPKFVTVDIDEEIFYIDLRKIDNDEKIYAKAKTIDLLNDQIIFELFKKK